MPRGNIEYKGVTKVADVIEILNNLAKKNEILDAGNENYLICRNIFTKIGALDDFDPANPGKMAKTLEGLPVEMIEEEIPVIEESKPESRALNKQDLKVILDEYDKYREKRDAEQITRDIQKNSLLKRVNSKDILTIIERKIKLETEELKKGNKPEIADKITDKRIETEERLSEVKPENLDQKEIEIIAEKITSITEESDTVEESRKKIVEVIKEIREVGRELSEEIEKTAVLETADKIVEGKVSEVIKRLTEDLADLRPTISQKEEIERIVKEKIEIKLEDPTKKIDDHEIVVTKENGKTVVETGENLSNKIGEILAEKSSGKETQIVMAVKNMEMGLVKNLFSDTINQNNPIDVVRAEKLEEEVVERMVRNGTTAEEAKSVAKMVRQLSFPAEESSSSSAEVMAMKKLEESGYHGGDNSRFAQQAGVLRNLIRSPVKISENVKNILETGDKLKGIKGFDQLKTVAKTLKENPALMRSIQLIQNVSKFQSTIGNFVGGITNPIGYILKIPALQEFGVQLATRFGGEMAGAMATQIANFGIETGLKNIVGQLFTTGTVTAVKAGATAAAEGATTLAADAVVVGAGAATGPPGWVIAALVMAAQLAFSVVKKIGGQIMKGVEGGLDKLNISTPEIKNFLQENFGKGMGGLMYWGGMAATFLLALPMAIMAGSVAIIAIIIPAVIGGLALMQVSTAQTVASLVPPKGLGADTGCVLIGTNGIPGTNNTEGDVYTYTDDKGNIWQCTNAPNVGSGNPDPNSPGLPGENIPGECTVSAAIVSTKQCDSKWASKQLGGASCSDGTPGTICKAGCGPASASMLLRRISGGYTPDTVIFSPGYPFSGAYTGMGCDGSSLQQNYTALSGQFGSKVQYQSGCTPKAIGGWICAGKVVFVLANFYRNANLELGGHFILAVAVQNGKIISADPYYPTATPFDGTVAFGYIHDIKGCFTVDTN